MWNQPSDTQIGDPKAALATNIADVSSHGICHILKEFTTIQSLKCPENWAQRTPIPMEKMPILGFQDVQEIG